MSSRGGHARGGHVGLRSWPPCSSHHLLCLRPAQGGPEPQDREREGEGSGHRLSSAQPGAPTLTFLCGKDGGARGLYILTSPCRHAVRSKFPFPSPFGAGLCAFFLIPQASGLAVVRMPSAGHGSLLISLHMHLVPFTGICVMIQKTESRTRGGEKKGREGRSGKRKEGGRKGGQASPHHWALGGKGLFPKAQARPRPHLAPPPGSWLPPGPAPPHPLPLETSSRHLSGLSIQAGGPGC